MIVVVWIIIIHIPIGITGPKWWHLIKDGPDSFKWKIIGIISMGKHCHTERVFIPWDCPIDTSVWISGWWLWIHLFIITEWDEKCSVKWLLLRIGGMWKRAAACLWQKYHGISVLDVSMKPCRNVWITKIAMQVHWSRGNKNHYFGWS